MSTSDLLPYLEAQPEPGRVKRSHASPNPAATRPASRSEAARPFWIRPAKVFPGFVRLFPLPGDRLDQILARWWSARAEDEAGTALAVAHRLDLRAPVSIDAGGWAIAGQMNRPGWHRRVPIVVEMWPALTDWTRVTMDPQTAVEPTEQWFREGHRSLERLVAQLDATTS